MLKTTELPNLPNFGRNNNKNVFVRFGGDNEEPVKKPRKSKDKKLAKSKKPSKSENSPKFYAKKTRSSFLILNAKMAFKYL